MWTLGGTTMARIFIPDEERKILLQNKYIFDVTDHNIYFNEEGKKFIYDHVTSGMSITKTLMAMEIPITPIIQKRKRHIRDSIIAQYKKYGNFKTRYNSLNIVPISASSSASEFKKVKELEDKLLVKEQELNFLKKITEMVK